VENVDQLIRENRPDLPIHVSLIWWTASNLSLMKSCSPRLAAKKPPPSHLPCCRRIHAWRIFTRAHALSSRRPWRRCRLAVTPPTQPSLAAADLKSPHASVDGQRLLHLQPARPVLLAVNAPVERNYGEACLPRGRRPHRAGSRRGRSSSGSSSTPSSSRSPPAQ
jgi:hypothetical protein